PRAAPPCRDDGRLGRARAQRAATPRLGRAASRETAPPADLHGEHGEQRREVSIPPSTSSPLPFAGLVRDSCCWSSWPPLLSPGAPPPPPALGCAAPPSTSTASNNSPLSRGHPLAPWQLAAGRRPGSCPSLDLEHMCVTMAQAVRRLGVTREHTRDAGGDDSWGHRKEERKFVLWKDRCRITVHHGCDWCRIWIISLPQALPFLLPTSPITTLHWFSVAVDGKITAVLPLLMDSYHQSVWLRKDTCVSKFDAQRKPTTTNLLLGAEVVDAQHCEVRKEAMDIFP
ncbi:hypothetical protein EJB05_55877, partial [Eragrostis curvula]